jgi:hypothetical protein
MGKYDGGMYETYIIGRTHITGETLTANLTNLDNAGNWAVSVEHGFGAKYDVIPFTNNQNYQIYDIPLSMPGATSQPYLADRDPEYLPYAGAVPQGSTFLHHFHLGAKYQKLWTFGAHYIYTWTPDDNWHPINSTLENGSDAVPRARGPIQGSIGVLGADVRLNGGVYGDGYFAYSHIDARNINALADSLEVIHSRSGYNFKQNFFGQTYDPHSGSYQGPQNETGTVDNLALQYSFSFGALSRYPEDWWGDGPDIVLTAFRHPVDRRQPGTEVAINGDPAHGIAAWRPRDDLEHEHEEAEDSASTACTRRSTGWGSTAASTGSSPTWTPPTRARRASPAAATCPSGCSRRASYSARSSSRTKRATAVLALLPGDASYPAYPYAWVARADANLVGLFASMWW